MGTMFGQRIDYNGIRGLRGRFCNIVTNLQLVVTVVGTYPAVHTLASEPIKSRERQLLRRDWLLVRGKAVLKIAHSRDISQGHLPEI